MKKDLQLAAFDMDGVVVDSMGRLRTMGIEIISAYPDVTPEQAAEYYDRTAGLPFVEQLKEIFGVTLQQKSNYEAMRYEELHRREAVRFPLNPYIIEVLNSLNRRGVVAVLVSSTGRDIIHEYMPQVHHLGFKAIYGYRLPIFDIPAFNKAAQINAACEAFQISQDDTILFGDSPKDKDAAQEAGVAFTMVTISTLSYWVEREWSNKR